VLRDILSWAATLELLGVAALPFLRTFFGNRRDAALLSRPVGLALVTYIAWGATLLGLPFERGVLMIALLLVGVCAYAVQRKRKSREAPGPFWGPDENRAALLFWASAAVFLVIRAAVPEILGQEKFMDLAFLNSLSHNTNMPPLDPWMSGKTINYYYWGYVLAAAATKLSGVTTFVSYNLALASFAGYSFVAAAALGMRLAQGRLAAGLAAGFGTVFAGNFAGALDGWNYFLGNGFDYFHASRIVGSGDTINEFPFFTFFQADLHPHLLGFPYFVAAFAIGHRFLVREISPPETPSPGAWASVRRWSVKLAPAFLFALVGGTAIAANLWTLPAIGILTLVICVFRKTRGEAIPPAKEAAWSFVGGAVLLYAAYALFLSYEGSFSLTQAHPENHGIARTTMNSGLLEFLAVWGILLAVGLAALWPSTPEGEAARQKSALALAAAGAASLMLGLAERTPALPILVFLGYLAAREAWTSLRTTHDSSRLYSAFLLILSLGMILGCEFVHFKDNYGDKLERMNTIFKFYHQAWPLLAIGVAVEAERRWRSQGRHRALAALLAVSVLLALLYPAAASIQRLKMHEGPITLDARLALERRNPADAAAISWLEKNRRRGMVIIEATGDPYSEYARISTHTGIPTVMGWANHEGLWRENDSEVNERAALVRAFYGETSLPNAYAILQKYQVTHVILGDLENRTYRAAGAVSSYPFLAPLYSSGTTVYQVLVSK
jgi:YYY domain-containing protein